MFRFSFCPSQPDLSAALPPLHIYLYLSLFKLFFQLLCFFPSCMPQFLYCFFQKMFFPPIFLFALYINEIGFFFSPMEDNHSSNCQLIVKFHSCVKIKKYKGVRALNTLMPSISIPISGLLASTLALLVISLLCNILPSLFLSQIWC